MGILQNPLLFACSSIVLQGLNVLASEVCSNTWSGYTYCEDGYYCCENDTRCCANELSVGAIIGIAFACVFVTAICVVVIIICKKKNSRPGTVVNSGHDQSVTVTTVSHQQPGYNQPYGQQPFGQPQYGMAPPPYHQGTNPAYPPPQAMY